MGLLQETTRVKSVVFSALDFGLRQGLRGP